MDSGHTAKDLDIQDGKPGQDGQDGQDSRVDWSW